MKLRKRDTLFTNTKDYLIIILGLAIYSLGFTAFILPHKLVIGGLAGISTLIYYATNGFVPVSVSIYGINLILLAMAFKIVGRTFVIRTLFGATTISFFVGIFEAVFRHMSHPIMSDMTMSVILGAVLCGVGIGMTFIHNGSSGGTDIVAAMVSKKSNVSVGRTMIYCDLLIISLSFFLPFDGNMEQRIEARIPTIVYGLVVTFLVAYLTDMLINTNRQAVQFQILSSKWEDIANAINSEANRGVTVVDGQGWYSHQDLKILLVWCRKIESVTIFRIVKSIDENALITQSNVNGVYGKGFDQMQIKMKKK
jgi:uncharacterized membrane-anchored protein YitT (DUF2179 family)